MPIHARGKWYARSQVSVNDLVIKAVAYALKAVPEANAYWTEDAIKFHPSIDVSFAAATVSPSCTFVCGHVLFLRPSLPPSLHPPSADRL